MSLGLLVFLLSLWEITGKVDMFSYGNSDYSFNDDTNPWTASRNKCKMEGGDLVSMETRDEWLFIKDKLQTRAGSYGMVWNIGLIKEGMTWQWLSKSPLTLNEWMRNQPSGPGIHGVMTQHGGRFQVSSLWSPKAGYICEKPKVEPTTLIPTPTGTPSSPSQVEAPTAYLRECLNEHNKFRALHGVEPLTWSSSLADNAQGAAERVAAAGTPSHSNDRNGEGENIAWVSIQGHRDGCDTAESCSPCRKIVDDWYREIQNYDFAKGSSRGGLINHFTQVVWRTTSEMGFGTAIGDRDYYYVARYYRGGNVQPRDNYVRNVPPLIGADHTNNNTM